ncbi:DUF2236 domain-containing protein [Rhodococcus erythropolis]|uniref:oxygenase MpaB family protein n=1 Tax=Rhodococcus erythropolis TaxID=1833 RepID=UPI002109B176|nr:oxygenase MpaB family protein [Rhodococcus erythropolis]MCQ4127672.1 DUF2236 domain-containing protein [Rhodococcus erythropolis]
MDRLVQALGNKGQRALQLANAPRIDDGYFGPDSISWKVYQNPVVIGLAGILGSVVAMLDPIGAAGVAQHSTYMSDPLRRVRRSNAYFLTVVYGDTAMAQKAGRDLFRVHSHVNGVVPATSESYRANHIDALKFTYICGFPSLWDCYTAFSGERIGPDDEKRFWEEQVIVAEILGIPKGVLPTTSSEVNEWVHYAETEIMAYTEPAQELVNFFLHPPMRPAWPLAAVNPFLRIATIAALSQLRPGARAVMGIPDMPVRTSVSKLLVRQAAFWAGKPIIDDFVAVAGYEAWGYRHNPRRNPTGSGAVPYDRDLGLLLQQGKGGTLSAPHPTATETIA